MQGDYLARFWRFCLTHASHLLLSCPGLDFYQVLPHCGRLGSAMHTLTRHQLSRYDLVSGSSALDRFLVSFILR